MVRDSTVSERESKTEQFLFSFPTLDVETSVLTYSTFRRDPPASLALSILQALKTVVSICQKQRRALETNLRRHWERVVGYKISQGTYQTFEVLCGVTACLAEQGLYASDFLSRKPLRDLKPV